MKFLNNLAGADQRTSPSRVSRLLLAALLAAWGGSALSAADTVSRTFLIENHSKAQLFGALMAGSKDWNLKFKILNSRGEGVDCGRKSSTTPSKATTANVPTGADNPTEEAAKALAGEYCFRLEPLKQGTPNSVQVTATGPASVANASAKALFKVIFSTQPVLSSEKGELTAYEVDATAALGNPDKNLEFKLMIPLSGNAKRLPIQAVQFRVDEREKGISRLTLKDKR